MFTLGYYKAILDGPNLKASVYALKRDLILDWYHYMGNTTLPKTIICENTSSLHLQIQVEIMKKTEKST